MRTLSIDRKNERRNGWRSLLWRRDDATVIREEETKNPEERNGGIKKSSKSEAQEFP